MLPQNSDVQKCPECGKYYFLADAKTLPSGEDSLKSKRMWLDSLRNEPV